jgi:hypothetical protein
MGRAPEVRFAADLYRAFPVKRLFSGIGSGSERHFPRQMMAPASSMTQMEVVSSTGSVKQRTSTPTTSLCTLMVILAIDLPASVDPTKVVPSKLGLGMSTG